ncbi:MAG: cysteine desulfurase, partial [Lachnospiraceae bacterium]|nr:cysteine desulfurase [Lachnospiraceae bacterium]
NPSSLHKKGMEAEKYVKAAQEVIAKTLRAQPKEIIFTSGGTEANNMALIGAALAMQRTGKHIVTTQFEHASVHGPLTFLEGMGFEVSFAPVDQKGHVVLEKLLSLIRPDTVLVSVMYVNNELGAVQDIAAVAGAVKEKKPDVLFHTDAIQAYGKYHICPKREGIDLLSVSGHKFHGPKGSGFLYIRDKVRVLPILYGGGQQKGMRSGTENVPAIAGIGRAAEEIYAGHEEKVERLYKRKKQLVELLCGIEGVSLNAMTEPLEGCAPHIVSAGFEGVRSEVLLHALEERGVYVSSGSACSTNHPGISGSLKAVGVRKELLDSTLRFSFSVYTTEKEVDYAATQLRELLPVLRRYTVR